MSTINQPNHPMSHQCNNEYPIGMLDLINDIRRQFSAQRSEKHLPLHTRLYRTIVFVKRIHNVLK